MRLFLAFPVPPAVPDYACTVQKHLREMLGVRGRWTSRNAMHMTAVFLDEQPEETIAQISQALQPLLLASSPIHLQLSGVTTFGHPPRVMVLEYEEQKTAAFATFIKRIRTSLVQAGIDISQSVLRQTPKPHVTLGRFRGGSESRTLPRPPAFKHGCFAESAGIPRPTAGAQTIRLDRLVLYQSTLRPTGAEYRVLAEMPLDCGA